VNRKCPLKNTILQLSTADTDPEPSNHHRKFHNLHVWNSHGYSRQRSLAIPYQECIPLECRLELWSARSSEVRCRDSVVVLVQSSWIPLSWIPSSAGSVDMQLTGSESHLCVSTHIRNDDVRHSERWRSYMPSRSSVIPTLCLNRSIYLVCMLKCILQRHEYSK